MILQRVVGYLGHYNHFQFSGTSLCIFGDKKTPKIFLFKDSTSKKMCSASENGSSNVLFSFRLNQHFRFETIKTALIQNLKKKIKGSLDSFPQGSCIHRSTFAYRIYIKCCLISVKFSGVILRGLQNKIRSDLSLQGCYSTPLIHVKKF